MDKEKADMIIYTTEDGLTKVETTFDGDTVWLSIDQMAELFQRDKSTISRHIKNIFTEGELQRDSVVAKFATTASDGKVYNVDYYNLDVIISVGYRVKSKRGTQFRIWATEILKEYMRKGFALDDDRLKNLGGGGYFKELLDRIRDIRAYYSWSNGNTERIAKQLAEKTGADLARIDTAEPYKGSHEDVVAQGKREVETGFMPKIKPLDADISAYDVIAIGTPTWWYTMAPAVLTFLTTHDFTGKTVIPFMTNGGWPGHVIKDMKANCKGADFAHEMQIRFDSMGKDPVFYNKNY